MSAEVIDSYLQHIQYLKIQVDKHIGKLDNLLSYIHTQSERLKDDQTYQYFYKAEKEFYKGHYEKALQLYLQAKTIPYYSFFCFRASAFVSHKHERDAKAAEFAKKALEVRPSDYITLKLIESSLLSYLNPQERQDILQEVEILKTLDVVSSLSDEAQETPTFLNGSYQSPQPERRLFEDKDSDDNTPNSRTPEASMINKERPGSAEMLRRLYESKTALLPETFQPQQEQYYTDARETFRVGENELFSETEDRSDDRDLFEQRVNSFKKYQAELIADYVEQSRIRSRQHDDCLYILNGWNSQQLSQIQSKTDLSSNNAHFFLTERSLKTSGGFFLRWLGKGIVINPGTNFLDNFHRCGLHVKDIDYVIVTREEEENYSDIKGIYDLNYQLNSALGELHLIHYYLNQSAYQKIGRNLKPNFKQERQTVHCLEIYLDSPDVEKIELSPGINLHYFPTAVEEVLHYQSAINREERSPKVHSALGVRLDLIREEAAEFGAPEQQSDLIRIGYVSGAEWSPLLAQHFGDCDVLIAGFENTGLDDYRKTKYKEECLGYYGVFSLLEEIAPKLLLFCEFGGQEGDIRIEAAKKMREEYAKLGLGTSENTVILPGDMGLYLDLQTLRIRCSVTQKFVNPSLIRVVKSADSFGSLRYLAPSSML